MTGVVRVITGALVPVVRESIKTLTLLALLALTVWGLLELFSARSNAGTWGERLVGTVTQAHLDKDGVPLAPRFMPAAMRSLAMVIPASVILGIGSLGLGYLFAVWPALSVLRFPLGLASAVPAFMFYYLGVPTDSMWFGPALCLALGDLNAATLTSHCYEGVRRELSQPYVRTAMSQGLPVWSDVWPRAVLIAIEGVCARVPHLLGGTVAVEYAFNIHGVGQMALSAVISSRPDYNILIWVAGLGIVAVRLLSLVHQVARAVLMPERGKSAAWSHEGSVVGLRELLNRAGSIGERLPPTSDRLLVPPSTDTQPAPSAAQRAIRRLQAYFRSSRTNRFKVVWAVCIVALGLTLVAVVLWGGGYSMLDTDLPLLHPSLAHPFGTNENGEDMLSAIALGGRELIVPLVVSVMATVCLGGLFGTLSGLCLGTAADAVMELYSELWESVPKLVIILAALTAISYTHYSLKLFLVMGLAFVPLVYRAVRDEVGALRTSLFLEAAVTLGISRARILWRHVVRNHALPVLYVQGAVLAGYLMLYDAILGYCRVRQRGEVFTWGNLLGTGLEDLMKLRDAGLDANSMIAWGPFAAMLIAIANSAVIGDALKSLGRSVRFSQ